MLGANVPADLDSVAVREPQVEHRDVRTRRRNPRDCLGRRAGLPDNLEILLRFEELA